MSSPSLAAVTGATGLAGAALVEALVNRGYRVRALVRTQDAPLPSNPLIERQVGDLSDPDSLARLCEGAELVFNTAGHVTDWGPRGPFWNVNCEGAAHLCHAALAAGVRRFVHMSTVDVFGFERYARVDERTPRVSMPYHYSASKRDGEERVWEFGRRGLPVSVVYPTWIFGPGDRHFLPELVTALKTGQLTNIDKGAPHLEVTYSENLAQACLLVATSASAEGEGYIVGDGYGVNLGDFLKLVAEMIGAPAPKSSLPYAIAYGATAVVEHAYALFRRGVRPPMTRYAIRSFANGGRYDLSKLQALGYRPAIDLREALRRSLQTVAPGSQGSQGNAQK